MSNYNELRLTYLGGSQETITLTGDTIAYGAYQARNIVSVEVPEIVQTIDGYAFCDNNSLANIVLNEGLQSIEGQAFQHGVYTAVTIPSTVTYIGFNSFNTSAGQSADQHTFTLTCLATTPPTLDDPEGITFGNPDLLSVIYVPEESVSAYQQAWPAYASKIQGGAGVFSNLNIKAAYVGTDEVVKMYLGYDVVWQPASSGSLLELVWDDTPGWYEPDPQNPAFSIDKARFRPYFNGEPLSFDPSQLDAPWQVNMSPVQSNKWIKAPTPAENLQDEWIELEWINGGSENDEVRTRSFEVAVTYSGYSASTTINVATTTGYIDWGGAIGQFGPNQAIAMSVNAKYYDGGMDLVTIPIANSGNNYNFGTWTYSADTPGDFAYIGYDNWDGQSNAFTFGWNRTGGTGNTYITMYADWCGFQTSAVLQVTEPVDPMFWEPLTIEIENPGTGETTGILWRLSGVSRTNAYDVSQYGRSIYYTLNDGPLTLVEVTGTPTTSKTVDVVIATGLSQGDVFKFYGASSAVGGYGFVSGSTEAPYHYFVNYAGLQAKVYGNIKSLLTDSTTWGDYAVSYNKEAIDNIAMNDRAFMNLFRGKTAFTFNEDATYHLVLPDRNLTTRCFADMFNGCTRMTVAPELPATALTEMCYYHLFSGCTGLVTPPELPATTLATGCYRSMFQYCTSLRDAPVLPAPVVAESAYTWMFGYCRNLTGVTCLAEDISANKSTVSWLASVNGSGTFTKSANMTGWTRDVNGIPTGWTIEDYVEPNTNT